MKQGTLEWIAARVGKVTASRIADVVAKIKSGESASRANYRAELIAERLTGKQAEQFTNAAMAWGTAAEPLARAAYEAETGVFVEQVGLIDHPSIAMSAASPDGLIGNDGQLEIKCPNTRTHIETILSGQAPREYVPQMQWQMACTGRQWCDFASFDPRMPPALQLFIVRVPRDQALIESYEAEVRAFLAEVADVLARLAIKAASRVESATSLAA